MSTPKKATLTAAALLLSFVSWSLGDGWFLTVIGLQQENSQAEIDRVLAISELRREELDVYNVLMDIAIEVEAQKQSGTRSSSSAYRYQLRRQFELASDNYRSIESALATLEGREPEKLRFLPLQPSAPTMHSVE